MEDQLRQSACQSNVEFLNRPVDIAVDNAVLRDVSLVVQSVSPLCTEESANDKGGG
jgi:hypothetical protein